MGAVFCGAQKNAELECWGWFWKGTRLAGEGINGTFSQTSKKLGRMEGKTLPQGIQANHYSW